MVTVSKLDNGNVLVHVDCLLKTGAVRQFFKMPTEDASSEAKEDHPPFVQILGRAFKWKDLLASGAYKGKSALSRAIGVDKANLIGILRLPYLSPIIVTKILDGELSDASVRKYHKISSPFWYKQHETLGIE